MSIIALIIISVGLRFLGYIGFTIISKPGSVKVKPLKEDKPIYDKKEINPKRDNENYNLI